MTARVLGVEGAGAVVGRWDGCGWVPCLYLAQ